MASSTDVDALAGTRREVSAPDEATGEALTLRRRYAAHVSDVWDACTDPDRLACFFQRPEGDLRVGGRFAFPGSGHGEVLRCAPPWLLVVSWVYGEPGGERVELRLAPDEDGGTLLELRHSAPDGLLERVPDDPESGARGIGTEWELSLIALAACLDGDAEADSTGVTSVFATAGLAGRVSRAWSATLAAAGVDATGADDAGR
ncbi:uncharacterized protein YndB with AHSA1/START domain [Actinoalloteichus hoggarensis]|uniref:Activator of Hsp90 ATPase homologue 1/2-like C-terminal domain-containing protein n=1 Tax=Actinoalloteichus hoggarensis TaxID=1470176 RepID=A0A221W4K1_9PSEU|nr:SRPBCC domain-containing protein [Actinoalloteichus hoggarensis]ASO20517.1 hypothetical protein AHOG_14375 [Actinoalloteichus hoggarensis]MBB5923557.1 uncharacterized protein YndB with AHSA1/START domain [Actinoalloteichus hoggarensis]